MYDVIIVGGGPAGITAGIYGMRKNLRTLLITKDFVGQTGSAGIIENWPGEKEIKGIELMQKLEKHLRHFGPEIREGDMVKKIQKENGAFRVITTEKEEVAKTIIIATGRNPRPLKVAGEERLTGKGVSYCVTCDGALFRNKKVVVVGGGDAGFMAALELKEYCEKVYIIENAPKVRAEEISLEKAERADNIEIITGAKIEEIKGDIMVESVVYEKEGEKKEIDAKGVFIAIGSIPATDFLNEIVEFNERGEIKIDPWTAATKTKGVFAAGDVTQIRDKQIVVACSEGVKALLSAYHFLKK